MPGCLRHLVQSFPFWRFSVQAVVLLFLLFSCVCSVCLLFRFFRVGFVFRILSSGSLCQVFPCWFCFSDLVIRFGVSFGRGPSPIDPFADHSAGVLDMVFEAMLSRTRRAGRLTRPGDMAVRGAVDARAVFGGAL